MAAIEDDEQWKRQGECIGVDPHIFLHLDKGRPKQGVERTQDKAKKICAQCVVIGICEIAGRGRPGIWGGFTEGERKERLAARRLGWKGKTMTYEEFQVQVGRTHTEHASDSDPWRLGQTYFNVLCDCRPDLSEQVRATVMDPFYENSIIPVFILFVEEHWKDGDQKVLGGVA